MTAHPTTTTTLDTPICTATQFVRERTLRAIAASTSSARISELARSATDAIVDVVRRHKVTDAEFHALKSWLISVGDSGEWPLLLDIFVERTITERANATHDVGPSSTEGPYYIPGQPHLPSPCMLPMREDEPGTPLMLTGRVTTTDGSPIAYANLDMWQTDDSGHYSGFTPGTPAGNLRGVVIADDQGCFEVETILPSPYRIPEDGAVGALFTKAKWNPWRPATLHTTVTKLGYFPLTTQLYFENGATSDTAVIEILDRDLVLDVTVSPEGTLRAAYRFVLGSVEP
ncbi:catechol 1,2 dioxygenase (plasmid) [Rhodococcus opacus]|uniref:Catechol 1,2 dioxygenase n=3 Tax=Rhodococcus opacus TaxID=37919 RepID=A0A1B1KIT2_RHOOP|nr:dioxygenase [Rhodococcus opacus]ANS32522.1 catechol 1,2 dioxygenase [Rhodococcus opacus]